MAPANPHPQEVPTPKRTTHTHLRSGRGSLPIHVLCGRQVAAKHEGRPGGLLGARLSLDGAVQQHLEAHQVGERGLAGA